MGVRRPARRTKMVRKTRIPRAVTIRPVGGVALRTVTKHRYYDSSLRPGTPTNFSQPVIGQYYQRDMTFFANGMYDPARETGGHQPIGYDQMSSLYRCYSVLSSTIDFHIRSANVVSSGGVRPCTFALYMPTPWPGGTPPFVSDMTTLLEQSGTRHLIARNTDTSYRMRYKWNCKQDFNSYNMASNVVNLETPTSATYPPTNTAFILSYMNTDASSDDNVFVVEWIITYKVLWSQPRSLTGS